MQAGQVFVSHASDMAQFPVGRSFVQAALDAVGRAGMAPVGMRYFAARDGSPARYCRQRVAECEVYVAVVGFRYGSVVPGEDMSYTELEFHAAAAAGLPRLVFLLEDTVSVPAGLADGDRAAVEGFRGRLRDAGLVVRGFTSADGLELEVFHALAEMPAGAWAAAAAMATRSRGRAGIDRRGFGKKAAQAMQDVPDRELDRIADRLAVAVREQWDSAAGAMGLLGSEPIPVRWRRPSRSLAGPVAAAVALRRFGALPGLELIGEAGLQEGSAGDLFAVVGRLGSGRLVIAGEPGSGKTAAALQLVRDALDYRDQAADQDRPRIPVPVLVTAQDWDLVSQTARDWLLRRMQQTYPMFAGKAGESSASALIAAGKIMVIVDGLDEIAGDKRAGALEELGRLGGKVRLVVLGRTGEMASAVEQGGLLAGAAAIELEPVGPLAAVDYLTSIQRDPPPGGWGELAARTGVPGSPLARALSSPLSLTLVRDTYRAEDDAQELLRFCDTAQRQAPSANLVGEITGHLLDRVLEAAYPRRPGEEASRYDLETAQNALRKIAAQMDQDGTYDLQWWHLARWAPATPRAAVFMLAVGLIAWPAWVVLISVSVLTARSVAGLPIWLIVWLVIGLMFLRVAGPRVGTPQRVRRIRLKKGLKLRNLRLGFAAGLVTGLVTGLGAGLVTGLAGGFAYGLEYGLVNGLSWGFLSG